MENNGTSGFRKSSRALALVLLGGVVLLVVATVVTSSVPIGCEGCHARGDFAVQTAATPHAELQCMECHGGSTFDARLAFGAAQVTGMVMRVADVDPTLASVESSRCAGCHEGLEERISEASGLRIAHKTCAAGRECAACHSPTAHGAAVSWPRTVTMEMCFECHGGSSAPDDCDVCHASRLPADRIKSGTFAVTHGADWRKTHGLGDMRTCVACHDSSKCDKCHGTGVPHSADFVIKHGEPATSADAKCLECHVRAFCSDCHGYEMPHPVEFRRGHARIVERDGEKRCERCHDPADCVRCHEDHVHPTTIEQLERIRARGGRS